MSDNGAQQPTSTPSRPPNRHRQSKSTPQVPTTGKKNNFGNKNRRSNPNNVNNQPKQESALTKKFREAAQTENGAASDSAINSIVDKGLVTPPATPGPSNRREPNAYVSDSAIGAQTDGNKKKNFQNKKKGKGKRPTDISTANVQNFTPPKETAHTPPDDLVFGKPTPNQGRYAGACFHDASPAPNALPLPKFFSKSVPTTSDGPSLSKMLAEAEAGVNSQEITDSLPPAPLRTPLDIFFKADKEEKARKAMAAVPTNDVISPKPLSAPLSDSQINRNITPPSAALPSGLGSPFGGKTITRDDSENDRDMLFSMDFSDRKTAPRPVEEVVIGPRHRPLSAKAYDPETLVKRQEKAKELKAALMQQQMQTQKGFAIQEPTSPSPKPKSKDFMIPDTAEGAQLSPTLQERRVRANNVGFAPAPRIRHFNQNRPVNSKANGQHNRNGRNQGQNFAPQNPFQPTPNNSQTFDPVRARIAESHIRGVLKLDAPIAAI